MEQGLVHLACQSLNLLARLTADGSNRFRNPIRLFFGNGKMVFPDAA
jgi:hypothetical protein